MTFFTFYPQNATNISKTTESLHPTIFSLIKPTSPILPKGVCSQNQDKDNERKEVCMCVCVCLALYMNYDFLREEKN